jgi:hypothetical protein
MCHIVVVDHLDFSRDHPRDRLFRGHPRRKDVYTTGVRGETREGGLRSDASKRICTVSGEARTHDGTAGGGGHTGKRAYGRADHHAREGCETRGPGERVKTRVGAHDSHRVGSRAPEAESGWERVSVHGAREVDEDGRYGWLGLRVGLNTQCEVFRLKVGP